MYKEKTTSLPFNTYQKPSINILKLPKSDCLRCGSSVDFSINTGKCPKGTTWAVKTKQNLE